jgi:hypothetical protein
MALDDLQLAGPRPGLTRNPSHRPSLRAALSKSLPVSYRHDIDPKGRSALNKPVSLLRTGLASPIVILSSIERSVQPLPPHVPPVKIPSVPRPSPKNLPLPVLHPLPVFLSKSAAPSCVFCAACRLSSISTSHCTSSFRATRASRIRRRFRAVVSGSKGSRT